MMANEALSVYEWTPSLDTNSTTAGRVLAATEELANFFRSAGRGCLLKSVVVVDADDQAADLDIWLLETNVAMGTENVAPSISDANAAEIIAKIDTGTGYDDLGGVSVRYLTEKDYGSITLRGTNTAAGSTSLFASIVVQTATKTFTASGLLIRFMCLHF